MPPKDKIETFTPVFPKGRVSTTDPFLALPARPVRGGAIMDPMPAAPAAFKKFLRDQRFSFFDIRLVLLFSEFENKPYF
jgi:hypothetical protein